MKAEFTTELFYFFILMNYNSFNKSTKQHNAAPEIYRQYIETSYKYIFLKYIANISGTRCTRSALARQIIF